VQCTSLVPSGTLCTATEEGTEQESGEEGTEQESGEEGTEQESGEGHDAVALTPLKPTGPNPTLCGRLA